MAPAGVAHPPAMYRYILGKLALIIPTFIGITILAFGFVRILPGDPVLVLAGERGLSPARHAELMHEFGFDKPLWQQYLTYLTNILSGDFGISFSTKTPVLKDFLTRFPATVEISIFAMIFAISVGIAFGVFAAVRRGSWFDQLTMSTALAGYSMPIFWWGLLLIIVFSGTLHWTPVSGRIDLMYFVKIGRAHV